MRNLLAATALTMTLIGGNAIAANTTSALIYQQQPTDMRTSKLIGMEIYAAETEIAADAVVQAGAEREWNNIGEISDVILSRDGQVKAVIVGIGGFLGLGEKNVAIAMDDIRFARVADNPDDYFLVINTSKEMLTEAPAYGEQAASQPVENGQAGSVQNDAALNSNPVPENNQAATDLTDPQVATNMNNPAVVTDHMLMVPPKVERNGYMAPQATDLTAEKLTGASVYGPKDEVVGEVSELVLNDDGTVKQLVLDIGGFLGMGEHRIALGLDEVSILRNESGDDVRVYVDTGAEALKSKPEYKAG